MTWGSGVTDSTDGIESSGVQKIQGELGFRVYRGYRGYRVNRGYRGYREYRRYKGYRRNRGYSIHKFSRIDIYKNPQIFS